MEHPRPRTTARLRPTPLMLAASALVVGIAALVIAMHASSAPGGAAVKTANTSLGKILVDGRSRTLYMFAADKNGTSACSGQCAKFWPPLMTTGKGVAGAGAKASLLGTITRAGGKLQVTYKGHPLYLFVKDTKAGQTNGEGLDFFGGRWWALSPSGAIVKKHAAAAAPAPSTTTNPDDGYGSYGP
jgi:predicted lipoprotein with Yx(FWY)xxD motif